MKYKVNKKIHQEAESLETTVRSLGYQLACKEIYGENSANYFLLRRQHNGLLNKLYRKNKVS